MNVKAKKSILKVRPYVPGKPIEEVQRELKLKSAIKLASNESPYGPSPKVLKAIVQAAKDVNRYPQGDCYYLRAKLAKQLGVSPNQLVFGNGSDEIIVLAIKAFVGRGDEVICARPSFLIYEIASKIAGASVKSVPLKDFCYDLDGMKKKVTAKTKMIFIGNPDNPGGTFVTQDQLIKFLRNLRSDIAVFLDEAYFEYVSSKDYPKAIKLLKRFKNLIVTRTFSKMYGLAGLRIGYGIASKEIIDILDRIREPFNVNRIAQSAALACLNDKAYYRRIAKKIDEQKKYLYKSFDRLGLEYRKSAANFILIDIKKNGKAVAQKLIKKGVIVRDMSFWGLDCYIRTTIGTPKENQRLVKVLKEILGRHNLRNLPVKRQIS